MLGGLWVFLERFGLVVFYIPSLFFFCVYCFCVIARTPQLFLCLFSSPPLLPAYILLSPPSGRSGVVFSFLCDILFIPLQTPRFVFFALHGHGCFHLAPCFRGWFFLVFFFGEAWNGILGIVGLHQSTLLVCRGCIETRDSSTHEIFHLKRDLCINAPLHRHP